MRPPCRCRTQTAHPTVFPAHSAPYQWIVVSAWRFRFAPIAAVSATSPDGTFRTSRDVRRESGMCIKADVRQPLWIYGVIVVRFRRSVMRLTVWRGGGVHDGIGCRPSDGCHGSGKAIEARRDFLHPLLDRRDAVVERRVSPRLHHPPCRLRDPRRLPLVPRHALGVSAHALTSAEPRSRGWSREAVKRMDSAR